ncbi:fluoride efflux transporter FluC [Pseudarthrobacter sp. J1763]|uniref:fluoride efflux transporter FluC n=1 Tax=Pseudarthrobacter sp. J1763 TaxID=3420445 RepID=UPI003D26C94D
MLTAVGGHSRRTWLAVAVGGFIGTEIRYGLSLLEPHTTGIPWITLAINVGGSFVLAVLSTWWIARPGTAMWIRAGIGPGTLGSFTTFSAVALSLNTFASTGRIGLFLGYLGLSLVLGLAAAGAGWITGQRIGAGTSPLDSDNPALGAPSKDQIPRGRA